MNRDVPRPQKAEVRSGALLPRNPPLEIGESVIRSLPDMDMASDKWREDILPAIEQSRYRDLWIGPSPTETRSFPSGTRHPPSGSDQEETAMMHIDKPTPRKAREEQRSTTNSVAWYHPGQTRIIEVGGTRITIRLVGRKGRRARITITAPAEASFVDVWLQQ